ncbi:MAG: GNAT family N-acetyltransferase [Clostridia bacterium]|nr:GNAT family N-acetyltransferase [Clostridia bacterium]
MKFNIYLPENGPNEAGIALSNMIKDLDRGVPYADMLRLRVSGKTAKESADRYFIAHENGTCISRLWNGWGRHDNAIGNFGHFFTLENMRGQGIGKKLLEMWHKDLTELSGKPLALFCTGPLKLYEAYGFKTVKPDEAWGGPLYLPLGKSPLAFRDFCEAYYEPSNTLICKNATVEWRHEIDCLLKFMFFDRGLDFDIGKVSYLEAALLYHPNKAKLIFTEKGRCVGWMLGEEIRLHPAYNQAKIQAIE